MLNYLFVVYLIFNNFDINVAKNSSSTTKKLSTDELLLNIQNQLLEIQDDIFFITNAIGQDENMDNVISKIEVTTKSFYSVRNELVSKFHHTPSDCIESAVKLLNNHCEAVNVQLNNLHSRKEESKLKRLPLAAIEEIIERRFDKAQEKLQNLNNSKDVVNVLEDVYERTSQNFDLLANLTESLTDINLIYNSVVALQKKTSAHGNGSPYEWIRLVKSMETGVINKLDVDYETKLSAKNVVNELYQSIRIFVVNALKANTGTFPVNGAMDNLTTALFLFDPSHSETIIEEFVQESFDNKESLRNIFGAIMSHRFIQQRVKGLIVLFWKIKDSRKLNDDVIFDISSALYKIQTSDEFPNLIRSMRIGVQRVIDVLPNCARNLFFLPSVCIWNKAREEYLTAGNSTFNHNKERRNIYLSEVQLPGSHWNVKRIDDRNFLFSSKIYSNEFLYAADFNFNPDYRYLFSWTPGNNTDKQSWWNIRLNGDYCNIKSATYFENMVSSNYKAFEEDNTRLSYVFTWIPKNLMDTERFQWQFRRCD